MTIICNCNHEEWEYCEMCEAHDRLSARGLVPITDEFEPKKLARRDALLTLIKACEENPDLRERLRTLMAPRFR